MLHPFDPDPIFSAKIRAVIQVNVDRGDDTENNPKRYVKQFWSFDGKFLAEHDPLKYCPEVD